MNTETLLRVNTFSYEKIQTTIYNNSNGVAMQVAKEIADLLVENKKLKKRTVLGLATGNTPKKIYKELIKLHKEESLSFRNVISFNLDEYYPLKAGSNQSYKQYMYLNFYSHIDIEPSNCFIPKSDLAPGNIKQHYRFTL